MARTPTSPARKEFLAKALEFVKLVLADIERGPSYTEYNRPFVLSKLRAVTSVARHRAKIEHAGWEMVEADPDGNYDYRIGHMLAMIGERGYAGLEPYDNQMGELTELIEELKEEQTLSP